jgi:hypothetical protein
MSLPQPCARFSAPDLKLWLSNYCALPCASAQGRQRHSALYQPRPHRCSVPVGQMRHEKTTVPSASHLRAVIRLTHFNGDDAPTRPTVPDLSRRFGVRVAFGVILRPSRKALREGQGGATSTVAERTSVTSDSNQEGIDHGRSCLQGNRTCRN